MSSWVSSASALTTAPERSCFARTFCVTGSSHRPLSPSFFEQGGDYVLQVRANQKSVKRQCETISRIRPLVGTFKKKS